jgi:hypothetical protein
MDDTRLNRRKFNRQPIQLSALVHPPEGRSWLCSIRDFCEEGMMLTGGAGSRSLDATGAQTKAGDSVALHFSIATPRGQEHFRTQAKVARVLDGGNGLGVCFESGLESRAFKNLVDFAVASGTAAPLEDESSVDDLPNVQSLDGKSSDSVSARPGSPVKSIGTLRDSRLSAEAAAVLTSRIQNVTKRAASRLAASFCKAASEEMLVEARDAGTNAMQTRYLEALEALE